jgi:hypothetical protein
MRQSMAMDNRDQILKDIDTLSLEKYVDEIVGAAVEGVARCKTEKDVWSAVEVNSFLFCQLTASSKPYRLYLRFTAVSRPHSLRQLCPLYLLHWQLLPELLLRPLRPNSAKRMMLQESHGSGQFSECAQS